MIGKHYIFFKQDVLNLLSNHKRSMALKVRELIANGGDPHKITMRQSDIWTEQFFHEEVERGEVKISDILDEVDKVTVPFLNKTVGDIVKEEKKKKKE